MKIIVDAYNVLHQVINDDHITEPERKRFINQLSSYAKKKGHEIIVVFDGGSFLFPVSEQQKGIIVKYAGQKASADDIILRYIKEHLEHSILLVSSDRELCEAAHYYKVDALKADDFYALLTQDDNKSHTSKKLSIQAIKTGNAPEAIDTLMKQVQIISKKHDDMEDPLQDSRKSHGYAESKKVKKRLHKIKKL